MVHPEKVALEKVLLEQAKQALPICDETPPSPDQSSKPVPEKTTDFSFITAGSMEERRKRLLGSRQGTFYDRAGQGTTWSEGACNHIDTLEGVCNQNGTPGVPVHLHDRDAAPFVYSPGTPGSMPSPDSPFLHQLSPEDCLSQNDAKGITFTTTGDYPHSPLPQDYPHSSLPQDHPQQDDAQGITPTTTGQLPQFAPCQDDALPQTEVPATTDSARCALGVPSRGSRLPICSTPRFPRFLLPLSEGGPGSGTLRAGQAEAAAEEAVAGKLLRESAALASWKLPVGEAQHGKDSPTSVSGRQLENEESSDEGSEAASDRREISGSELRDGIPRHKYGVAKKDGVVKDDGAIKENGAMQRHDGAVEILGRVLGESSGEGGGRCVSLGLSEAAPVTCVGTPGGGEGRPGDAEGTAGESKEVLSAQEGDELESVVCRRKRILGAKNGTTLRGRGESFALCYPGQSDTSLPRGDSLPADVSTAAVEQDDISRAKSSRSGERRTLLRTPRCAKKSEWSVSKEVSRKFPEASGAPRLIGKRCTANLPPSAPLCAQGSSVSRSVAGLQVGAQIEDAGKSPCLPLHKPQGAPPVRQSPTLEDDFPEYVRASTFHSAHRASVLKDMVPRPRSSLTMAPSRHAGPQLRAGTSPARGDPMAASRSMGDSNSSRHAPPCTNSRLSALGSMAGSPGVPLVYPRSRSVASSSDALIPDSWSSEGTAGMPLARCTSKLQDAVAEFEGGSWARQSGRSGSPGVHQLTSLQADPSFRSAGCNGVRDGVPSICPSATVGQREGASPAGHRGGASPALGRPRHSGNQELAEAARPRHARTASCSLVEGGPGFPGRFASPDICRRPKGLMAAPLDLLGAPKGNPVALANAELHGGSIVEGSAPLWEDSPLAPGCAPVYLKGTCPAAPSRLTRLGVVSLEASGGCSGSSGFVQVRGVVESGGVVEEVGEEDESGVSVREKFCGASPWVGVEAETRSSYSTRLAAAAARSRRKGSPGEGHCFSHRRSSSVGLACGSLAAAHES